MIDLKFYHKKTSKEKLHSWYNYFQLFYPSHKMLELLRFNMKVFQLIKNQRFKFINVFLSFLLSIEVDQCQEIRWISQKKPFSYS